LSEAEAEAMEVAEDKKKTSRPILESLNHLFFISKFFGMIPYSLPNFIKQRQFQLSQLGNIWCVLSCIHYIIHYHILMASTMLATDTDSQIGALTMVIGIFIIYMEPFMMATDTVAALVNQRSLLNIFDRLRDIDDKLSKENISLNYNIIRRYTIVFVFIAVVGEMTIAIFNLYVFQAEFFSFESLWWLLSCVPLFNNSIAKIWFLMLILLVQQRLQAINYYLNDMKRVLAERKVRHSIADSLTTDWKPERLTTAEAMMRTPLGCLSV